MKFFLILALVLLILGSQVSFGQSAATAYDISEAYSVYAALLEKKDTRKLVIQTETEDYPTFGSIKKYECLESPKGEESIYDPIIADYKKINEKTWLLQRKFPASVSYELVPKSAYISFFEQHELEVGWKNFYKKYPGSDGITKLSAVGFNAKKTIAIVYLGNQCGGLCGGGVYHVLRKNDGKWSLSDATVAGCVWAS